MPFQTRHRLPLEPAQDESPQPVVVGMGASGYRGGLLGTIGSERTRNPNATDIKGSGRSTESFHVPQKTSTSPAAFSRNLLRTRDLAIKTAFTDKPRASATSEAGWPSWTWRSKARQVAGLNSS
jgi:hypothetical protein